MKVRMLVALFSERPPVHVKDDITVDDKALLPDGVLSYQFKAGLFWNSIKSNVLDGKTYGIRLDEQDKQVAIDGLKWLPGRVAKLKEKRAAAAVESTVSQKVAMLVAHFPVRPPRQGKDDNTIVDDPALLPDGISSYQFKAGQFWGSIINNFLDGKTSHVRLGECDKQIAIDGLQWLPGRVAELKAKRAKAQKTEQSTSQVGGTSDRDSEMHIDP
eukprot:4238819-Prymnesium_polylepis.2